LCRVVRVLAIGKGATRGETKRAEAPPLAKSKLKKDKYRVVLIFFVSQ